MERLNYDKVMRDNGKLHCKSVIALADNQIKAFKRFCKKWATPSGNDNKNHFFIYAGPFAYHIDFIKTSFSGQFAKISKICPPVR